MTMKGARIGGIVALAFMAGVVAGAMISDQRAAAVFAADIRACQRILDHLRSRADYEGIALLADVPKDFPQVRKALGHLQASHTNLRHMANLRDSGEHSRDKGRIELGSMEDGAAVNEFPNELIDEAVREGAKTSTSVNRYERDPDARARCLEH